MEEWNITNNRTWMNGCGQRTFEIWFPSWWLRLGSRQCHRLQPSHICTWSHIYVHTHTHTHYEQGNTNHPHIHATTNITTTTTTRERTRETERERERARFEVERLSYSLTCWVGAACGPSMRSNGCPSGPSVCIVDGMRHATINHQCLFWSHTLTHTYTTICCCYHINHTHLARGVAAFRYVEKFAKRAVFGHHCQKMFRESFGPWFGTMRANMQGNWGLRWGCGHVIQMLFKQQ